MSAPPNDLLSAVAIAMVMILTAFAVQALKNVVVRLWSTVRVLFQAMGAIALASGALALTAGVLLLRIQAG